MPFKCSICLEDPRQPVITPCGHLFCWTCLDAWATQRGHRTVPCPTCNGAVDIDNDTTPIYGADGDDDATRQHPSQFRNTNTNNNAGNNNNHNTYPGQQYRQNQQAPPPPQPQPPRPPPQAHRRAEAAPPPVNRNPFANFFGGGGAGAHHNAGGFGLAGGLPIMFMHFGGNFFHSVIMFALLYGGYQLFQRYFMNNNGGNQQQQQNHNNNNNGVFRFHDTVRNYLIIAWNWIKNNITTVIWMGIVLYVLYQFVFSGEDGAPNYEALRNNQQHQQQSQNSYRRSNTVHGSNSNHRQNSNNNNNNNNDGFIFHERNMPRHQTYNILNMLFDVFF